MDMVGAEGGSLESDLQKKGNLVSNFLSQAQGSSERANKGMSEAFGRTRGAIDKVTGGLGGLLPAIAGFGAVSAVSDVVGLQHEILDLAKATGLSAESASQWTGAAKQVGLGTAEVQSAFKFLSRDINTAQLSLDKHTASGAAAVEQMHKVQEAQDKLTSATSNYNDVVRAFGENSQEALKAHDDVLRATDALTNAQTKYTTLLGPAAAGSSQLQAALKDLNISLLDSNGKAKPFNDLLGEISDSFVHLQQSDPEKVMGDALAIFGRGGTQILPLLLEGSKAIKELMQNTADAGQVFSRAALDNGEKTFQSLNKLKLGATSLLTNVANDISPIINLLGEHTKAVKAFVEAGLDLYATHKGISIFKGVVKDVEDLTGAIGRMLGVSAAASHKGSSVATTVAAEEGQRVFVTNWEMIRSGGGGIPNYDNELDKRTPPLSAEEPIAEEGFLSKLGTLLGKGLGIGGGVFAGNMAGQQLGGLLNNQGLGGMLGGIGGGAAMGAQVAGPYGAIIGAALGAALGAVQNWDDVKRGAQRVGGLMRGFFESLGTDISKGWGVVAHDVGGFFGSVGGRVGDFFGSVGSFFHSLTPEKIGAGIHDAIATMFRRAIGVFSDAQVEVYKLGSQAVGAVGGFFTGPFVHFFTDLPGRIGSNMVAAKDGVILMFAKVTEFFVDLPSHLASAFKSLVGAIGGVVVGLGKAIAGAIGSVVSHIGDYLSGAVHSIGSGISSGAGDVGHFFKGLLFGGAQGGIISEPILGFGTKTGSSYLFGEAGKEMLMPMSGGTPLPGGGPGAFGDGGTTVVNNNFDLRNTQMWHTRDIDDLVEKIGGRLAKVLAPQAGLRLHRI